MAFLHSVSQSGIRLSARGRSVAPCTIMQTMDEARVQELSGRRVIHFEIGQPCSPAPVAARTAAAAAMTNGTLGYTAAAGLPALRAGIARHYAVSYSVDLDPDRIIVTAGASAGFVLALTSLFDPGDCVAIGDPGYPSYRNILRSLGLTPVGIQTRPENKYQPVPADLPAGIAGMLLASPANPTGSMIGREELSSLLSASERIGASVISDEVYHGIHYGERPASALEFSDDVYVVNSFSKFFAMTGWRVGWIVLPPSHVEPIKALMQNLFICAPHISQIAALAALDASEELEKNVAVYRANRDILLEGLPKAGFRAIAPPDGAFFLYVDVSDLTDDSRTFATQVLHETGVAITHGGDFDPIRGGRYLRFSYACNTQDVEEGLERLMAWSARHC